MALFALQVKDLLRPPRPSPSYGDVCRLQRLHCDVSASLRALIQSQLNLSHWNAGSLIMTMTYSKHVQSFPDES